MRVNCSRGFTLIEFVLATLTLVVAATAILGAYVGQVTLNEHARNLSLAIQDASRVIEQIRVRNTTPCVGDGNEPTALFPPGAGVTNWDTWLANLGGGRSLQNQNPIGAITPERVVVTCQDNATLARCGTTGAPTAQVGANESTLHPGGNTGFDPIRVTVAVCWRHRNRTIGQCSWNGTTLTPDDSQPFPNGVGNNVIESPAMLTTIVTCRSQ